MNGRRVLATDVKLHRHPHVRLKMFHFYLPLSRLDDYHEIFLPSVQRDRIKELIVNANF